MRALPRRSVVPVLLLCGCALLRASPPPPQQPRFGTSSDLVVVPVVVVDRRGQDVTTLTAADFEVKEDGTPVAIDTFVAPAEVQAEDEAGRFVVVAIDNIHTPPELLWRAKSLAGRIVEKVGPNDRLAVIALSGGKAVDSNDRSALTAAIGRIGMFGGAEVHGAGINATALMAIEDLASQIAVSSHRRKVIAVIGPANMYGAHELSADADGPPSLSPAWIGATQLTGQENVSVYVIDPRGQDGRSDFAAAFASATGGMAWASNDWNGVVERLWRDSGVYYLLGYQAPVRDARPHAISVRVRTPGLTVRARRIRG